jgi:membrane protease YdiL (CAAX protease family)
MTAGAIKKLQPRKSWIALGTFLILPQLPLSDWIAPGAEAGGVVAFVKWLGLALAVIAWVMLVEKRSLSSIGIRRPGWDTLVWALVMTAALVASIMLSYALILPALGLEMNRVAAKSITELSIASQLALFVRAAVTEEILFRGYPIERLLELTRSKWIAALLPGAFFIGGHYWWGAGQMVVVALGTAIFSLFYLWRRDLLCCMIAHFAADLIGFTMARLQG